MWICVVLYFTPTLFLFKIVSAVCTLKKARHLKPKPDALTTIFKCRYSDIL